MEPTPLTGQPQKWQGNLKIVLYIAGALLLFLFSIDLMVSSLQHLGSNMVDTILFATANPFNGLFIGLLITAMLQSSSTTTSLVVAFVASGSITLQSAIPIIIGANVGTTITSTIVSLGFINRKKEFRRAVAAGTYHDFFNILTVIVIFPLEYYYRFLSGLSEKITNTFFTPLSVPLQNTSSHFRFGFDPVVEFLIETVPSSFVLALVALGLLFSSILFFRKIISDLLKAKSPEAFSRFFFKNQVKSFVWGLLTTGAIRSSTITTSVVVPIVAKRIASLQQAAPFIMGANIGTTITAFIAAALSANTSGAVSIALAHFLFNFTGVLLFFPIPFLRQIPIELANRLGKLTLRYRLMGLVYLLSAFFFIPFTLIYFNQHSVQTLHLTYEETDSLQNKSYYRLMVRKNAQTNQGAWTKYAGKKVHVREQPVLIYPISVKSKALFIGKRMVLFNRPGFCWNSEQNEVKNTWCVKNIINNFSVAGVQFDSVYLYDVRYPERSDSAIHRYYFSAPYKIMLLHEIVDEETHAVEKLILFEER